jgi:uncharacterized protein
MSTTHTPSKRTVVVLGASDREERYAYKAIQRLLEKGFSVIPVNPSLPEVLGLPVQADTKNISEQVDTVTVYLSAKRSSPLAEELIALAPKRIIINPGAENPELEEKLTQAGIQTLHACTLVLLGTGQF